MNEGFMYEINKAFCILLIKKSQDMLTISVGYSDNNCNICVYVPCKTSISEHGLPEIALT